MSDTSDSDLILDETAILADILNDDKGDVILACGTQLSPEDFSDPRNRILFKTMLDLENKNIVPEIVTLNTELANRKLLTDIGGSAYLNRIFEQGTSAASVTTYIDILKERALLSQFLTQLKTIVDDAQTKPITDISEFIGKSERDIVTITQKRRISDAVKLSEVSDSIVTHLVEQTKIFKERGIKANGITGTPTGYANLDNITKGWHPGDMIVIGARPSVGKTAFALNLLYQVAKKGTPVIFFSLEMSALSIAMRLLEMTSDLTADEINSMEFMVGSKKEKILVNPTDAQSAAKITKLQRGLQDLSALPFYIDDNPGSKMMDIVTKCKKLSNLIGNVGLIAIDYIGLITSPSKANQDSRQQEVSDISRQLKQLARDTKLPILALSQLSRASEKRDDHRPVLADLRDSGAIEQDADIIMMLYRKDYYKEEESDDEAAGEEETVSNVKVNVSKNRNGPIGEMDFIFDKPHCQFSATDTHHDSGSDGSDKDVPF
jgi:replicative DNA helicase